PGGALAGYCVCLSFFSSRRRHTRFSRDWSSDVCSSDLSFTANCSNQLCIKYRLRGNATTTPMIVMTRNSLLNIQEILQLEAPNKIGRASCRERVYTSVVERPAHKKQDYPIEESGSERRS